MVTKKISSYSPVDIALYALLYIAVIIEMTCEMSF